MKTKLLLCLMALFAVAATNVVVKELEPFRAKLTVKVLDEAGQPFPGVDVQVGFEDPKTRRNVYANGMTDAYGLYTAEGICDGSTAGGIRKDGYYWSGFPFKITGTDGNHWIPWNPICEATLRPIGKPIALYAKRVQTRLPELDKPCGYDLESGDWVTPYGKGIKSDFIFTLHQEDRGMQDYDLIGELTFKNSLDGLLDAPLPKIGKNSAFKWARLAPENIYQQKFSLQNSWHNEKGMTTSFKFEGKEWEGYFFRVRSVEQDGKLVSAHYGKIRGGIEVFPDNSKPKMAFTYYFNPTPNDRNLEWDTKRNLFSGLKDMQTPHEP